MNLSAPDRFFFFFFPPSERVLVLEQQPELEREPWFVGAPKRGGGVGSGGAKEECFEDDKELWCRGSGGITAVNLDAVYGSLDRGLGGWGAEGGSAPPGCLPWQVRSINNTGVFFYKKSCQDDTWFHVHCRKRNLKQKKMYESFSNSVKYWRWFIYS